ncbi:hypothetical protein OG225_07315 [Nocardia sp. NBC_01377]|uniref:hypothetical protein n=1 Tax=Nocardia sp. NBC_01377 TaxID=2903595 RepID=UPI0032491D78
MKLTWRRAIAAVGLISATIIALTLVVPNRQAIGDWLDLGTTPWGSAHQETLRAFPDLLPRRQSGEAWQPGYYCAGVDYPSAPEIRCSKENHPDPYLVIVDLGSHDAVLHSVEIAPGTRPDRPVHHPSFPEALIGTPQMRVSDTARVFVWFPPESPKSRFLLEISWKHHTEDDVFDRWLPTLPIRP